MCPKLGRGFRARVTLEDDARGSRSCAQTLLAAARLVERHCDAVDINFGCPQGIAKKGNYGSFLMDDFPLVYSLINKLHKNLAIPVTCKIRRFEDDAKTLQYAKLCADAGASVLTLHGRTREHKGPGAPMADWNIIRKVRPPPSRKYPPPAPPCRSAAHLARKQTRKCAC